MLIQLLKKYFLLCICVVICSFVFYSVAFAEEKVFLLEEFENLDNWEPFEFPKIKEHSTYTIVEESVPPSSQLGSVLKAESNASASAIMYKEHFDVYEYPLLEWRWKVENVYEKGDAKKKSGDDYPLRIYVVFEYDPKKASFGKRLKYKAAKARHGEYPPHSLLNYIWANKEHTEDILTNKYADESKMVLLRKGKEGVNTWQVEHVNVLEDYRKAFDEDPPKIGSIVIMNDSDNTKEHAVSYVDYIKVYQKENR
jgi:hypothetical protein